MRSSVFFYFIPIFILISCSKTPQDETQSGKETMVGSDKDPNGCIGSAGYTWSEAKKDCIRIFESGTAFVAYDAATGVMDSTQVAYVVLADDKSRAEVFYGGTDKPILMEAVAVMEGETMPTLYENTIEMVDLIYYRDSYILRFQENPTHLQVWSADSGLGKELAISLDQD
jgi:putative Ca2+/H+ antiporter (TMEM165/GDT1 family)